MRWGREQGKARRGADDVHGRIKEGKGVVQSGVCR